MASVAIGASVGFTGLTGSGAAGAGSSSGGSAAATSEVAGTELAVASAVSSTSLPIMSVQVTRAAGAWASRSSHGLSPSIDSRTSVGSRSST